MSPRIRTEDYIRPTTAARLAGVARSYVHHLVAAGTWRSVEIDGHTYILRADVEAWERTPGAGRPRDEVAQRRATT